MQPPTLSSLSSVNVIRVRANGPRFDLVSIRTLLAHAQDAIQVGAQSIVIDLSGIASIDSVGVSALVSIRRRASSTIRIVLAGLSPAVQTVARVCHLHEVFDVYTSYDAAERALAS
jgi:anti-sigma B factor antagonist